MDYYAIFNSEFHCIDPNKHHIWPMRLSHGRYWYWLLKIRFRKRCSLGLNIYIASVALATSALVTATYITLCTPGKLY